MSTGTDHHLEIVYDRQHKIWKSQNYPYGDFVNRSIGELFLEQMRTIEPQRVLEDHYDLKLERTASQIYRESVAVAKNLQCLGVKSGDVVVIYSMINPQVTPLTFGCYLIGAVVNFFEPKLIAEHIDYVLQILDPIAIVYEQQWRTDLYASLERSKVKSLQHLITIDAIDGDYQLFEPLPTARELAHFNAVKIDNPQTTTASLLLTSGSTGVPKVCDLSHAIMLNGLIIWWNADSEQAKLNSDSVLFSFSPLRWISQIEIMFQSVLLGYKRVCVNSLPAGDYGRDIINKTKITHFFTTPTIFIDILRATNANINTTTDDSNGKPTTVGIDALNSLRMLCLGGESPPEMLIERIREALNLCRVYYCYGMTEVSSVISNDQFVNGGKILNGFELKILDDNLTPLPAHEPGQLCIRTPVLNKGYYKNREANAAAYFEDGFFLNGDYGFVDSEHRLHVLARYKDLIRGSNITIVPNQIENFMDSLAEVNVARMVGFRKSTDDNHEYAALFVLPQNQFASAEELNALRVQLRHVLKAKVSTLEYDIILEIHFVDKMPLTTCGKIDRVALRKLRSNFKCD